MHAGFEFEAGVGSATFHRKSDFFVTANARFVGGDDLRLVAVDVGVFQVHAQQICHEQAGFIAAGAGTDLNDNVAVIAWVFGNQHAF